MPRKQRMYLSALNIVTHPHSPENYVAMFERARRQMMTAKWRSDRGGLLLSFYPAQESANVYFGQVGTFIALDANEPWLSFKTGQPADENEMREINLPTDLQPSLQRHQFVFFPDEHRLVFHTRGAGHPPAGPSTMRGFLSRLLNKEEMTEQFGPVGITIEPEQDALDRVFGIHQLEKLTIYLERPNPDSGRTSQRKWQDRLKANNAHSEQTTLQSTRGEQLTPDEATREHADIAQSNGWVYGKGKDENGVVDTESTERHNLVEGEVFDPSVEDYFQAMMRKAQDIVRRVAGKNDG